MVTKRVFDLKTYIWLLIFVGIIGTQALAAAPRVVKTVPENRQKDVDPKLREIRIEFDQDMSRDGFSICGGGPKYPKTIGKPRWIDNRTIVMRVRLEVNHDYELSVNCRNYKNFRNLQGQPAVVYPIRFRTGSFRRNSKTIRV